MLLQIHIVAGALALIVGAVALLARKGVTLHRQSGQLFVCSMLTMGITASVLGPIPGGLMPVYFGVTALTTVRPVTAWTRWVNLSALVVAIVLAVGSMSKGFQAFASPGGVLNVVFFDPGARREGPSRTIYHARHARSPNCVGVHRDVLLAVACPSAAESRSSAIVAKPAPAHSPERDRPFGRWP